MTSRVWRPKTRGCPWAERPRWSVRRPRQVHGARTRNYDIGVAPPLSAGPNTPHPPPPETKLERRPSRLLLGEGGGGGGRRRTSGGTIGRRPAPPPRHCQRLGEKAGGRRAAARSQRSSANVEVTKAAHIIERGLFRVIIGPFWAW